MTTQTVVWLTIGAVVVTAALWPRRQPRTPGPRADKVRQLVAAWRADERAAYGAMKDGSRANRLMAEAMRGATVNEQLAAKDIYCGNVKDWTR